jgi:transitional endoplasmic reticulum ATPase
VDNKEVEFPDKLCGAIAGITDGFSFAYMQEAFVASLLAIARRSEDANGGRRPDVTAENVDGDWISMLSMSDDDLDKLALWVEIQKQVEILRGGMGKESLAISVGGGAL